MFGIGAATAAEIVGRVVIVYIGLLLMLRVAGRRTLSDITPLDMLVMLLVSETVSPALTAGDESVTAGLLAAGTLVVVATAASALAFRSRRVELTMSGSPATLIKDGKVDEAVLRTYRITSEDLETALHRSGVLAVREVRRAFVEPDGEITVVKSA
jgi:uncharacterized membrane protein YcaP (DUF421 family)